MAQRSAFASGFSWQSVNVLAQVILQLGFTAIMARQLTTQDFGIMSIVLVVMGFIEIFSQIGIGPALIQRKSLDAAKVNGAFFISVYLGIGFFALLFGLAPAIEGYFGCDEAGLTELFRVVGLSFIISAVAVVPRSLIIKEMAFKKLFYSSVFAMSIGLYGVGVVLAFLDYGVWAYAWALIAQNVLLTIAYWLQCPQRIRNAWKWADVRDMIRYGGGSTLFNFFNYAASKADVILVGKYSGMAALADQTSGDCTGRFSSTGVYDRAVWLMTLPVTILGKLSDSVLFSGISRLQDDQPAVQRVFLSGTYFISMLVFPGCIFLVFFSEEVVLTLLGDQYLEAVPVARILFVGVAFRALIKLSDAIVRALDAVYIASAIKGVFLVLVIAGTLWGLEHGLIGVATNLVVAIGIQYILMLGLSLRLAGLNPGRVIGKMIPGFMMAIATGVVALVPFVVLSLWDAPPLIGLILATGCVLAGWLALAWFAPWLFGKGRDNVLRMLAPRLPNRGFLGRFRRRIGGDVPPGA